MSTTSVLTIYIGYDSREPIAYEVCKASILKHASKPVNIQPLYLDVLRAKELFPRELVKKEGKWYDPISEAYCATEFSITRFMAMLLQQEGWAVFMDSDMLLVDDIYKLVGELDNKYAVQCVKHAYVPKETVKMDGQVQTYYFRKNWSSFFAFNASHPSNLKLKLSDVMCLPGRSLHSFSWLKDEEIGELQQGWNWLVNVVEKPDTLFNLHYTLGGPWFPEWKEQPYDEVWLEAAKEKGP